MNTNTGELGLHAELIQTASDPTDVVPIPEELKDEAQRHRGRFVNLRGKTRLAQFAKAHQRHKKRGKPKARSQWTQVKRNKCHLRRRSR